MGIDKLDAGLAPFGYGQLTGIDISGEKPGLLPSPAWKKIAFKHPADQVWFPGETVNMGIGQGYLLVTPLQLAHIVGVIAERGRSFRPRLVIGTRDADGRIKPLPPVEEKPVDGHLRMRTGTTVIKAMMGDHDRTAPGTSLRQGAPTTPAARPARRRCTPWGRTRSTTPRPSAENLRDHAWFIAFAPAEEPRIAIAVLVGNAGFGAGTAAPIARKCSTPTCWAPTASSNRNRARRASPSRARSRGFRPPPTPPDEVATPMIREELTDGPSARARTLTGAARMLLGAEAGRPAAGGPGTDRGLRPRGALQCLRPEPRHRHPARSATSALGTIAMLVLAQVNPTFCAARRRGCTSSGCCC